MLAGAIEDFALVSGLPVPAWTRGRILPRFFYAPARLSAKTQLLLEGILTPDQ